jgi:hypothetical protein
VRFRKHTIKIILILVFLLQGCSYIDSDKIGRVLSTDYYELDNSPKDAEFYECEDGKSFYIQKLTADEKKDLWIIFKNSEYRLNYVDDLHYENTILDLKIQDDSFNVIPKKDNLEKFLYSDCKRQNQN